MNEPRYYADIGIVKELTTDVAVTINLEAGWELLAIKERTKTSATGGGVQTTTELIYVMGLKKEAKLIGTERGQPQTGPHEPDHGEGESALSKKTPLCRTCKQPIGFAKIDGSYPTRWRPTNLDGTPHDCKKGEG